MDLGDDGNSQYLACGYGYTTVCCRPLQLYVNYSFPQSGSQIEYMNPFLEDQDNPGLEEALGPCC